MDQASKEESGRTESQLPSPPERLLRFDAPHRSAAAKSRPVPEFCLTCPEAGAESSAGEAAAFSQLRAHAAELHEQLTGRMHELERREAQLNSRSVEMENELRRAELRISEREAVVVDREKRLQTQATELEARAARLDSEEAVWRDTQTCLEREAEAHRKSVADFEARRQAEWETLELERRRLLEQTQASAAALDQQGRDLQYREAACAQRERLLDAAEAQLQQQAVELRRQTEAIRVQRQELDAQAARQQQLGAERNRRMDEQLADRQADLDEQARTLQQRGAALDALEREISRLHAESLETRLVTEQLQIRLQEEVPGLDLTKSIAALRARMIDEQRLATAKRQEQREEIKQLAARLKKRREELESRRGELQAWFERRQAELEDQALTLAAREEQFQQQRWELWEQREAFQQQRRQLEQQVRELTFQLQRTARQAA